MFETPLMGVHVDDCFECPDQDCRTRDNDVAGDSFEIVSVCDAPVYTPDTNRQRAVVKRCSRCGTRFWHHASEVYIAMLKDRGLI